MALGMKALVGGAVGETLSTTRCTNCYETFVTNFSRPFFWGGVVRPPGGLAGAASRITGAMAKGVAAMTMDEEYQQKRREAMNTQPSGLKEGLTRGGKGLVSVCNL